MDREFHFLLYEDRVECKSPAKAFGESYTIPINEIVELEEDSCTEESCRWSFITNDGQKNMITPNYGNPVHKIVAAVRQLRPNLPIEWK